MHWSGVADGGVRLEQNEKVFVMGEEVAQYNGAYKVTKVGNKQHN